MSLALAVTLATLVVVAIGGTAYALGHLDGQIAAARRHNKHMGENDVA